jgi:hypothetical protein
MSRGDVWVPANNLWSERCRHTTTEAFFPCLAGQQPRTPKRNCRRTGGSNLERIESFADRGDSALNQMPPGDVDPAKHFVYLPTSNRV